MRHSTEHSEPFQLPPSQESAGTYLPPRSAQNSFVVSPVPHRGVFASRVPRRPRQRRGTMAAGAADNGDAARMKEAWQSLESFQALDGVLGYARPNPPEVEDRPATRAQNPCQTWRSYASFDEKARQRIDSILDYIWDKSAWRLELLRDRAYWFYVENKPEATWMGFVIVDLGTEKLSLCLFCNAFKRKVASGQEGAHAKACIERKYTQFCDVSTSSSRVAQRGSSATGRETPSFAALNDVPHGSHWPPNGDEPDLPASPDDPPAFPSAPVSVSDCAGYGHEALLAPVRARSAAAQGGLFAFGTGNPNHAQFNFTPTASVGVVVPALTRGNGSAVRPHAQRSPRPISGQEAVSQSRTNMGRFTAGAASVLPSDADPMTALFYPRKRPRSDMPDPESQAVAVTSNLSSPPSTSFSPPGFDVTEGTAHLSADQKWMEEIEDPLVLFGRQTVHMRGRTGVVWGGRSIGDILNRLGTIIPGVNGTSTYTAELSISDDGRFVLYAENYDIVHRITVRVRAVIKYNAVCGIPPQRIELMLVVRGRGRKAFTTPRLPFNQAEAWRRDQHVQASLVDSVEFRFGAWVEFGFAEIHVALAQAARFIRTKFLLFALDFWLPGSRDLIAAMALALELPANDPVVQSVEQQPGLQDGMGVANNVTNSMLVDLWDLVARYMSLMYPRRT
ncbi:hypothetical protein DFJ74DRAFT_766558, partial [Hyaloraphidium curvatum]